MKENQFYFLSFLLAIFIYQFSKIIAFSLLGYVAIL